MGLFGKGFSLFPSYIKGLIIELTLCKSPLLFIRHARRSEAGIQCLLDSPVKPGNDRVWDDDVVIIMRPLIYSVSAVMQGNIKGSSGVIRFFGGVDNFSPFDMNEKV